MKGDHQDATGSRGLAGLGEAKRIVEAGQRSGVPLRLLGGLAVQARAPAWQPARRPQRDIDLAARRRDRSSIVDLLEKLGYHSDRRFNALHGHKQLYFMHAETRVPVDVLLDELDMCHRLNFADRLELEPLTLPLADLLLSKLQIVRLNQKDLTDIFALLHENELGQDDESGVNVSRIVGVTAGDWGWWRTVRGNLERATEALSHAGNAAISIPSRDRIRERVGGIQRAIEESPKPMRWRLRARIGERLQWYEEPEEEEHG